MTANLYIASAEPQSSKSLVALGVMEMLSRRISKLGFFRPVIRAGDRPDNDIQLIRARYRLTNPYEASFAMTHDQARRMVAAGEEEELLTQILARYKELDGQCECVVCEGTDFTGVAAAFEFDFNALIANQLGCPVLIVASGQQKTAEEMVSGLHAARAAFVDEGCEIAATIVNRVPLTMLDEVRRQLAGAWRYADPIFALPQEPLLTLPTFGEIVLALGARLLMGSQTQLQREVHDYKVAAMHVPSLLDYLHEGSLVLTPGDRADVMLGSLAAFFSENFPKITGLLLTGGIEPASSVRRLLEGFRDVPVPIAVVDDDTFSAARRVDAVPAQIGVDNDRKIAAALGLFESHVDLDALERRIAVSRSDRVSPRMFQYELVERAKADPRHLVLPEGDDERILRAAEILLRRGIVKLTLLGSPTAVHEKAAALGIDLQDTPVIDPATSPWHKEFADKYLELRRHKGVTEDVALDVMRDVSYFGTMMVYLGKADGMVSGAAHTTAHTIRPAFEFVRARPGVSVVSSVFFMCLEDRVLVYGDCAVVPNPDPPQLADIAISSAETARMFGIEPVVAMLSYSSGQSGSGEDVDRVREATRLVRQRRPELLVDGPMQYDAAVDPGVGRSKMPDSPVAGRATVFVFPDLNTGNNTYKAVQRSSGAVAIGPVLQGLNKPVNDLSRGCTVADIVNTVAITAIQAQAVEGVP